MEELKVNGEFLFQFDNFTHWVNKASSKFRTYSHSGMVCVAFDKNGKVCHIGEDFMNARDNDLFPIKVYSLERAVNRNA